MISLKRSLDQIEELDQRFKAALRCYLSTLSSLEVNVVEVEKNVAEALRQHIRRLRAHAAGTPVPDVLETTRRELDLRLREFSSLSATLLKTREREIREILTALAEASSAMAQRADHHAGHFRTVARELEAATQLDSISLIRERLTQAVGRLKACTDRMWEQNQAAAGQMEDQLRRFQARLQEAETLAMTDPLTGLPNRRRAENLLQSRILAGAPLCLILFDLDHFKTLNDRYGHPVGDQVLRAFGERLRSEFPPEDVICRWGGDEFLVIVAADLEDPLGRARQATPRVSGLYAIKGPNGPLNVEVSASAGAAGRIPGEDADKLFSRADASLYQEKWSRRQPQPGAFQVQTGTAY